MKVIVIVLSILMPDGAMMQKVVPAPSVELNKPEICEIAVQKTVADLSEKFKDAKVFGGCFELDGAAIDKLLPPKA